METRTYVETKDEFLSLSEEDARQLLLNYIDEFGSPLHITWDHKILCGTTQSPTARVMLYALRARPSIYEGPEVRFCDSCVRASISISVSNKVQS